MQKKYINQAKDQKLKELILSKLSLTHISEEILDLKEHLTTLDLSNNELAEIPSFITELKYLEQLDLKNNKISNINIDFSKFINLKILSLKGNMLEKFPSQILKIDNLQELSIARNRIDAIPGTISQLKNLKIFFADGNRITELPDKLADLKELVAFTISENPVSRTIEGGLCHFVGINRVKNFIEEKNIIRKIYKKLNIINSHANIIIEKIYNYMPSDKQDENIYLDTHFQSTYLEIRKIINSLTFDIDKFLTIYSKLFSKKYILIGREKDLFTLYISGINKMKLLTRILSVADGSIRRIKNGLKQMLNNTEKSDDLQENPELIIDKINNQMKYYFL